MPEPQATFLIAVTDLRWLAHVTPGMEWHSTGYDHDVKIVIDPTWRTSTVTQIAQGIDDTHDFSVMPILGDALQEAGCDNYDILNHCRDEKQVHVRGCWVVDLVLGKS
ncbi:MAG: hypothetical protein K8U57_39430 [Planctomycetes bacterium]|nr:hypothetical protein [Planctomycetota bacterium]